jgi:hypothetical protein
MAGQRASGTYKVTILNAQARSLIASSWVADEQSKFQAPVLEPDRPGPASDPKIGG